MSTASFLPSHTERAIAAGRIVLGASGLFAIWMDPAEPVRFVATTYTLHATYLLYSIALAGVMWNRSSIGRLPLATHLIDIALFSIFQYLTLGPSSPFFTYFVFSLFCGALRWGWRGTLGTSVLVVLAYVTMGASMSRTLGPTEFELNRFIIRAVYLCLTAALLVYLGRHEEWMRTELGRLNAERLREESARDQRLHVARDLHDGVLQSLTGIRFELQAVASTLATETADAARDHLLAIERALAIEQRELRLFIDDLKPPEPGGGDGALADRLHALRERVALEWKVPVTIRITPEPFALSAELQQAVPLMAHEAIVNAAKHAHPTRIAVDVRLDGGTLRMTVSDDGSGFAFRGRYAHQALEELNLGPASLRERAASLGGEMSIESTATGSRVEIAVPLG